MSEREPKENTHDISIRALDPSDLEEFRTMRLRALQLHLNYFGESAETAKARPKEYWLEGLSGKGKRIFGLFDSKTMIGITAAFTWREDPSFKTGFLAMSFIEPEYRGHGYSSLFYDARLNFALEYKQWTKLRVSHREGNAASRAAILKNGFCFIGKNEKDWPDQTNGTEHNYELDLCALRMA